MTRFHRGADALVEALAQAGVRRIFTLSGNHIMPVFDACLSAGIELIHTRHEASAVHMADAWARLTGDVGVALVTGGPGHANAISALYTAQMSESPVLLLSGHAPASQVGKGAFQEMLQAELAAPVTKASWTCVSADALAAHVLQAMQLARAGRPGPVHLSLPTDALEGPVRSGATGAPAAGRHMPGPSFLAQGPAREVRAWLAHGERPLVLAGPTALTARGRRGMAALEMGTGVPVIGMESPRGSNDPSLGNFASLLARTDRILLLGKRLDFTLRFGAPPALAAGCEFMQIDPDASELARTRRAVGDRLILAVQADTGPAAVMLGAQNADAGTHAQWRHEVALCVRARAPVARSSTPGLLHPQEVCSPLQAILDSHPDSVLISDGGEFGQWAQACLHAPHRLVNGPAGAIGSALPMALAARLAVPQAPVLAFMGDGTVGFHIAEFETAVRRRLPFVAVIGNDARWNAEYQIQINSYGAERAIGCELLPTRYDQVCVAFGGHGEWVRSAAEMLPAVQRAIASGLPACVNVAMEGVAAPTLR
jgi:acetolactate synthase-1/2/3 large subunit